MNIQSLKKWLLKLTFFKSAQIDFLDDFRELIDSGIEEKEICLNMMRYGSSATKCLAGEMLMAIRNGKKITVAMDGWFSKIIISTIAAGRETGDIMMGLNIASNSLQDSSGLTSDILNAIKYPITILTVIVVISGGPVYDYFLQTQGAFPLYRWSSISHAAWVISDISHNWQLFILATVISGVSALAWILPNVPNRGGFDNSIVFKQYRDLNAIAVLASVSSLMKSGLGLKDCLSVMSYGSSPWLVSKLSAAKFKITSGKKNYGDIFDVGLMTEAEIQRLKILSNSGDISGVLMKSAQRQRRKLKKQILRISFFANLMSLLTAGIALAVIAGGAYLVVAQSARVMP